MVWTQALRNVRARLMIPKFFDMGYSASAALREFSKIGPGLRRKLWLANWREITGAKKLARAYRFIPRKFRLSFSMMAPTEVKQQRDFKYVFEATGRNLQTNEMEIRTVSFGDDTRFSIADAENLMVGDLRGLQKHYKDAYDWVADSVELKAVYRKELELVPFDVPISEAERQRWLGL